MREPYQGVWIKDRRKQLGFTQEQLVKAVRRDGVRISRSHLANIEAGIYAPSTDLTRVIATRCEQNVRDTWLYVGTLARTKKEHELSLLQLSQVADTGPAPHPDVPDAPAPPDPHASATELLDWARHKLASLASAQPRQPRQPSQPGQIVLTTAGPLAAALRAAPPPDGHLGGILGRGIRAVLEEGAALHHILTVPDDPDAHFEILAQALPLAARYCLPASPSHPYLSRYRLTLVPDHPASPDLVASSSPSRGSLIVPVISAGRPGVAVVETTAPGHPGAGPDRTWASDYASWLAASGTDLFSWFTVIPAETLSLPAKPWEEQLTAAWEHAGGRDSIQRMLPLNTMSDELRSELVAAQAGEQGAPGDATLRLSMYRDRRRAMINNLENDYRYRNVVTHEALDDLVRHGQYTMERVPGNVLTADQVASYLRTTIELIRDHDNFEVLILTDKQLEQALPLGVSWMVKRSPRNQAVSTERAWAFLPYELDGNPMAMNVIVSDKYAVEAIGARIDALWSTWVEDQTPATIREETLAHLAQAQHNITVPS